MIKKIATFTFILILMFTFWTAYAENASLSFTPLKIIQGDPFLVTINGVSGISSVKKLTFAGKKIPVFMYDGVPSALVGIDLNKKPGAYQLTAELLDGSILNKSVLVGAREKIEKPLGIPEKLGGDTKTSQDKLVSTLVAEKNILANIKTGIKAFWTQKFTPPLKEIFVTDAYGYSRKTGEYSIAHKGVDYRAPDGTDVMAINRGIVRITKNYRNYGNTIVVDHGLGVMSFYLHLSKIKVKVGDVVDRGQIIGLSGDTGYAEGAHLHLSIRINNISIDPVKFLELFN